jgi:hypothetical protein
MASKRYPETSCIIPTVLHLVITHKLQHSFILKKASDLSVLTLSIFRAIDCTVFQPTNCTVTSNYLLFCDVSPTFFGPYAPSSGRLFTKEYVYKNAVKDVHM